MEGNNIDWSRRLYCMSSIRERCGPAMEVEAGMPGTPAPGWDVNEEAGMPGTPAPGWDVNEEAGMTLGST